MYIKKLVSVGLALAIALSGVTPFFEPFVAKAEASDFTYTKQQQEALAHINNIRSKIGVPPVKLNLFLSG